MTEASKSRPILKFKSTNDKYVESEPKQQKKDESEDNFETIYARTKDLSTVMKLIKKEISVLKSNLEMIEGTLHEAETRKYRIII